MRCKGCNRVLSMFENRLNKPDGTPEDLCSTCRRYTYQENFTEKSDDNVEYLKGNKDEYS